MYSGQLLHILNGILMLIHFMIKKNIKINVNQKTKDLLKVPTDYFQISILGCL